MHRSGATMAWNVFNFCTALRGLGSIMILLVLGVVLTNYGPALYDGGLDSVIAVSVLLLIHFLAKCLNMSNLQNDPLLQVKTTCGSLLYELQIIWDEVGETDTDRDKMLLELEQECLEVYRRRVDQANRCRAQLRQEIADSEAELAAICSAMGEQPVHIRQADQNAGSLKEELRRILPQLEEMKKRRSDRRNQFLEVVEQIQKITNEIGESAEYIPSKMVVDETDLTLRKLEELHRQLHALQTEKNDSMKQIEDHLNALNSLCLGLCMESEGLKNISNDAIQVLATAIQKLTEIKLQRMLKEPFAEISEVSHAYNASTEENKGNTNTNNNHQDDYDNDNNNNHNDEEDDELRERVEEFIAMVKKGIKFEILMTSALSLENYATHAA